MEIGIGYTEWTYLIYLIASIALTVWVARTLFRSGRIFLIDACRQNEPLADAINHLLVVGFYLINVGFVTLALKYGTKPTDATSAIEFVSTKIGLVLLVLGGMHFFNLYVLAIVRRRGMELALRGRHGIRSASVMPDAPPIEPDALVGV